MKFKIDENLPIEIGDLLRTAGHDALTVYDQNLVGESDHRLVEVCRMEQRAVLTMDLDFCDERTYPPQDSFGLIVLRLHRHDKQYVLESVKRILPFLKSEQLEKKLWIVEENRIRIR
ncbi:MAG: DUF5615 family PIN-like protein [Planctomycetaceae bacterium]